MLIFVLLIFLFVFVIFFFFLLDFSPFILLYKLTHCIFIYLFLPRDVSSLSETGILCSIQALNYLN